MNLLYFQSCGSLAEEVCVCVCMCARFHVKTDNGLECLIVPLFKRLPVSFSTLKGVKVCSSEITEQLFRYELHAERAL